MFEDKNELECAEHKEKSVVNSNEKSEKQRNIIGDSGYNRKRNLSKMDQLKTKSCMGNSKEKESKRKEKVPSVKLKSLKKLNKGETMKF